MKMSGNLKRIISLIIAVMIVMSIFSCAASAGETDVKKGTFTYMPSFTESSSEETFYYSDEYFTVPSAVRNQHLTTMSLALAFASMEIEGSSFIRKLYEDTGFEDIQADDMDAKPTPSSVGTAIAHKRIGGSDLVALSIRGNKYGAEWAANLTAGESGNIEGFDTAAKAVTARLIKYIKDHKLQNVKLWIAGYSRGGSIADLIGVYANEHPDELCTKAEDIFVYAFEAPRCCTSSKVYSNIFCVKNKNDLITYVYPENWGLYTNGIELTIGEDKSIMQYKIDILNPSLFVPLGEIKADEFNKELIDFIGSELTRDKYSGRFDSTIAGLIRLYFSKPSSEWQPTLDFLKNEFINRVKSNDRTLYILVSEVGGGIVNHNSDKMYQQLTNEILLLLNETATPEDLNLTEAEYQLICDNLYDIIRVLGPLFVKDYIYEKGIDYSTALPKSYNDASYDPQTAFPPILTYDQYVKYIIPTGDDEENETRDQASADAEDGEIDGRSNGYDDGYNDGLNGRQARTDVRLPDDAESRSEAYLSAYVNGYKDSYLDAYGNGVSERSRPRESDEYTSGCNMGEKASDFDAKNDALSGIFKASYNPEPRATDDNPDPVFSEEYARGFKKSYIENYERNYYYYAEYYRHLTLYHIGTLIGNMSDILQEHYPQSTWNLLTKLDSYYNGVEPAPSETKDTPESNDDADKEGVLGDVNGDNTVDSADALAILRCSVGLEDFSDRQKALGNTDGDDSITSNDALSVLRYSINMIDNDKIGTKVSIPLP